MTLPEPWLADLPLDGDTLVRPVDTRRAGYFRTPVYRGLELVPQPLTKPVLILSDSTGLLPTLFMNTDSGQIGTSLVDWDWRTLMSDQARQTDGHVRQAPCRRCGTSRVPR